MEVKKIWSFLNEKARLSDVMWSPRGDIILFYDFQNNVSSVSKRH